MATKTHVGFWLAVFIALFFLTPVLRNGAAMEAFVQSELMVTRATFGDSTADWLKKQAGVVFEYYTPSGTLTDATVRGRDMDLTRQVAAGPGVAFALGYNSYVQGLVLNLFVVVLRFFIFAVWLVVLWPVFVASVVDGFVRRSIKRAEFGAMRPAAYTLTSLVVIPLAMAPLLYLVIPVPISPLISPIWACVLVLPLSAMVSNMQPIFGRN
jgi:hypothetical protein